MITRHNRHNRHNLDKEVDQMPSAIRVIRLSDGHIFESTGDAARSAGITLSGMTRAIQRSTYCDGELYAALPSDWDLKGDQIDIWCKAKIMDIIIKKSENKMRRKK